MNHEDNDRAALDERMLAATAFERGRIAGLEEAAQVVASQPYAADTKVGLHQQWVKDQAVAKILALASRPSEMVCVERPALEKIRNDVRRVCAKHDGDVLLGALCMLDALLADAPKGEP